MYDIFYVSASNGNDKDWATIKSRYPLAQKLTNIRSYEQIQSKSFTKMFWVVWDDAELTEFNLLDYHATKWDDMYVHVFRNGEHYDGVCLFPKSLTISQREFHHRFFTAKKEIDIVASIPKQYNKYYPSTFEEYQTITDDMFWVVWPEVVVTDITLFETYFSHHNSYDRRENHVFKNLCNENASYLSGVILCSKYKLLSNREFDKQYAIDKKEHDVVVSKYQYPLYKIKSYDEYLNIVNSGNQQMFWCQWPNTEILDNTIFDLYFDPNDGSLDYDRSENHVFKNMCNDTESYLSGVVLFSKSKVISKKEFDRKYLIDKKEHDHTVSRYRYNRHAIVSYDEYKHLLETETQPMFWGIWPEIDIIDDTVFDLYFDPNDGKYDHDRKENHVFKNLCNNKETYLCGLVLFSTTKIISEREFNRRYLIDKKEHDVVVSRYRYNKYTLSSYDEYVEIGNNELQPMFWGIWPEIDIIDDTVFDLYFDPNDGKYDHDRKENHVFKNLCNNKETYLCGVVLFSKSKVISKKEFNRRYLIDKKEHVEVVSRYRYNKYVLLSYDEYKHLLETETQPMFWCQWPEIEILDNKIFDLYFDPNDGKYDHDRSENHVFKNMCNDTESYLSGLVLFSKSKVISKKEFDRKYLVDKKEHNLIVSRYRYSRYIITSYNDYKNILETETQPMFWCQWPEIEVTDNTVFDLYFDPNDGKYDHDRVENHVFKNLCNDKETYLCGLVLFSTEKIISQKEFNRRYLIDKKEHVEIISRYRYNRYVLSSYDNYTDILKNETQPMFWGIWPEIDIVDESVFDLYFDPNDGKYDHDRKENHSFKHLFNDTETYSNGIVLLSKNKIIGQKEFTHRFLIEKKEHDRLVSKHHIYDVVFISYNEPNADENYNNLLVKCPRAKRVHGVKGIHQAHIAAAELCDTDMIWAVDGDAVVDDDFNFDLAISSYDIDCVHVWRSRNPLNGLEYGYGGVKLLPRQLTLDMDVNSSDMTTSISKKFKAVEVVSNITLFNIDKLSTWRSAFRECAKLASRSIQRHLEEETNTRLDTWCTTAQGNYSSDALRGAREGRKYGEENKNNPTLLSKINDFDWLKTQFEKTNE